MIRPLLKHYFVDPSFTCFEAALFGFALTAFAHSDHVVWAIFFIMGITAGVLRTMRTPNTTSEKASS